MPNKSSALTNQVLKVIIKFTMIVCFCHPTSERDVDAVIDEGARTVEDIGRRCGAGTGCGSCLEDLRERLSQRGTSGCPRDCAGDADEEQDAPLVAIRAR
jgi:bacterioferritin-associated ferredoxin